MSLASNDSKTLAKVLMVIVDKRDPLEVIPAFVMAMAAYLVMQGLGGADAVAEAGDIISSQLKVATTQMREILENEVL